MDGVILNLRRIWRGPDATLDGWAVHARSLAPLEKTRGFGMTPSWMLNPSREGVCYLRLLRGWGGICFANRAERRRRCRYLRWWGKRRGRRGKRRRQRGWSRGRWGSPGRLWIGTAAG